MKIRIDVKNDKDGKPDRIDSYVIFSDGSMPRDVISFSIVMGEWGIASSTCISGNDLEKAKKMHECMGLAFKKLDEILLNEKNDA